MCNSHAIRANVNKASKQAKRRECLPCERHSTLHILLHRFRKVNQNPQNVSSESPSKCSFLKSSTLPGGFMKNILLVSPIWTWICITMLTHADYKNRIRSHEKPENLDSTWSKHVRAAPKKLSISWQTNRQHFIGQNWQVEMWNYAQNGSNPMISNLIRKFSKQQKEAVWVTFGDVVSTNVLLKYVIEG